MGSEKRSSQIGDLDGDGKSDLVYINTNLETITIFRNRVNEAYFANAGRDTTICPGKPVQLGILAVPGSSYSWTSNPAGFTSALPMPIVTSSVTTSYFLTVVNSAGYTAQDPVVVSVVPNLGPNTWTGAVGEFWNYPQNWSLGVVPNACSDVIINSGTVILDLNVTLKSLTINPSVIFIINPGYNRNELTHGRRTRHGIVRRSPPKSKFFHTARRRLTKETTSSLFPCRWQVQIEAQAPFLSGSGRQQPNCRIPFRGSHL